MTDRLYYSDSHMTKFTARVVAVADDEQDRPVVTLNRTAFYPTGGGQPSDTGTLGAAHVVECIDLGADGVRHVIEGDAPAIGAEVACSIDWPRRLDHLQQHTAQHILSQSLIELFNAETHGFRIMERASEIDVTLTDPTDERIERAVDLANRIIWEDRSVHVRHVTPEQATALPLRKEPTRTGTLRVIEIEGFDLNACGGTHAQRTGEVGIIAVSHWERAKGMTRVEFIAGGRALTDYRRANRTARDVAAIFSVARDESTTSVARLFEENKNLLRRTRALEEIAARVEAEEIINANSVWHPDGSRIVTHIFDGRDAESLKRLALAVTAHPRTVAILGSRDGDHSRLAFARSAEADGDMGALMREACTMLDGRGGGRPDTAQGGGRNIEKLEAVIEAATRRLLNAPDAPADAPAPA
ncbi:MAG: DHHA1 domain-containing protein [Acidobacteriota bacterium]|nr:DHHA1 domain-containing protein [Acidobacteriota bacterium]